MLRVILKMFAEHVARPNNWPVIRLFLYGFSTERRPYGNFSATTTPVVHSYCIRTAALVNRINNHGQLQYNRGSDCDITLRMPVSGHRPRRPNTKILPGYSQRFRGK